MRLEYQIHILKYKFEAMKMVDLYFICKFYMETLSYVYRMSSVEGFRTYFPDIQASVRREDPHLSQGCGLIKHRT